jgi:hypothetical protein
MIVVVGATGLVGTAVCQEMAPVVDQFGIHLTSVDEYAHSVLGGQETA